MIRRIGDRRRMSSCLWTRRFGLWLALACLATLVNVRGSQQETSGRFPAPRFQVESRTILVGQPILALLEVIAGSETPRIQAPALTSVELTSLPVRMRTLQATGIGSKVDETILYQFPYRLVARRSGRLTIPPFQVESGQTTTKTVPVSIESRFPPGSGRPRWFEGGVGPLQLEVQLSPTSLPLGESASYRVRLQGDGAFGTEQLAVEAMIRNLEIPTDFRLINSSWNPGQAERTWIYELRPTRAGRTRIPPLLVATYDPELRKYTTFSSHAFEFEVVQAAEFNVDRLESAVRPSEPWRITLGPLIGLVLLGAAVACVWVLAQRSARGSGMASVRRGRRIARRTARRLREAPTSTLPDDMENAITSYLREAGGWPGGTPTPVEIQVQIERIARDDQLGAWARLLAEQLDRLRYGGEPISLDDLRWQGQRLFGRLAQLRG